MQRILSYLSGVDFGVTCRVQCSLPGTLGLLKRLFALNHKLHTLPQTLNPMPQQPQKPKRAALEDVRVGLV